MTINPKVFELFGQRVEPDEEPGELASTVTESQVAARYDAASGVPGWTAKLVASGRFEVTPPLGYVIVNSADGGQRLAKVADLGIQINESKS